MDQIIKVNNLTKSYGSTKALNGISLEVNSGEVLAFLGPNGAGKTTAINILTGLIRQDGGDIHYNGKLFDPEIMDTKRLIGVVPQGNNLERDLSCVRNLKIHGYLYGMYGKYLDDRVKEVLDIVDLWNDRDKTANALSGGMKRRLVVARALLHEPQILFLDEPSTGLDPVTRRNIHTLIRKLNHLGVTIFMTTHYIEEADVLSSKVIFIDKGSIVATGTAKELKQEIGTYALEYTDNDQLAVEYFSDRKLALERAESITSSGNAGVRIREVSLEDVYIRITGKGLDAKGMGV